MICGDLMVPIGHGYQEVIPLINMEIMEYEEFHLHPTFLVVVVTQEVGLIPIIIFGYLEVMVMLLMALLVSE